jgi:hypothetical protein
LKCSLFLVTILYSLSLCLFFASARLSRDITVYFLLFLASAVYCLPSLCLFFAAVTLLCLFWISVYRLTSRHSFFALSVYGVTSPCLFFVSVAYLVTCLHYLTFFTSALLLFISSVYPVTSLCHFCPSSDGRRTSQRLFCFLTPCRHCDFSLYLLSYRMTSLKYFCKASTKSKLRTEDGNKK